MTDSAYFAERWFGRMAWLLSENCQAIFELWEKLGPYQYQGFFRGYQKTIVRESNKEDSQFEFGEERKTQVENQPSIASQGGQSIVMIDASGNSGDASVDQHLPKLYERSSCDWRELQFQNGDQGFYYGIMIKSPSWSQEGKIVEQVTFMGRGILLRVKKSSLEPTFFGSISPKTCTLYECFFQDGKPVFGRSITNATKDSSLQVYEGDFNESFTYHGEGTLWQENLCKIKGKFEKGRPHGQCQTTYYGPDGDLGSTVLLNMDPDRAIYMDGEYFRGTPDLKQLHVIKGDPRGAQVTRVYEKDNSRGSLICKEWVLVEKIKVPEKKGKKK
ncbi:hypothetical protein FGO68_gene14422 [Halteria grandinella]|uniref:MORN repeat protein n=1 Tax=Halteria grandinella TaxID=5974 RepID=A0A8J8NX58_HALGN|nr:hypothetical protein FGO68_gene14422 [Halteria grandinella]